MPFCCNTTYHRDAPGKLSVYPLLFYLPPIATLRTIACDILVCEILFRGLILIVSVLLLVAVALNMLANMLDQIGWQPEFRFYVIIAFDCLLGILVSFQTLHYPLICVFFRTMTPFFTPGQHTVDLWPWIAPLLISFLHTPYTCSLCFWVTLLTCSRKYC